MGCCQSSNSSKPRKIKKTRNRQQTLDRNRLSELDGIIDQRILTALAHEDLESDEESKSHRIGKAYLKYLLLPNV